MKSKKALVIVLAILAVAAAVFCAVRFSDKADETMTETEKTSNEVVTKEAVMDIDEDAVYKKSLSSGRFSLSYPDDVLEEKRIDLDGDGIDELLVYLSGKGEYPTENIRLFDIDKSGRVFNGGYWEMVSTSRCYSSLAVMREDNGEYYFFEDTFDGNYGIQCQKIVYKDNKLTTVGSVNIPDHTLIGYANPDFAKCTVEGKTVFGMGDNPDNYADEDEITYITYEEAIDEWNRLAGGEFIYGFCDITEAPIREKIKITRSGNLSDSTSYKLYESGYLMICGEGKMPDLNTSKRPWDVWGNEIKYIAFEKGITHIGDGAFGNITNDMPNIELVLLPEGLESIGSGAFSQNLDLVIQAFPESLKRIEEGAFYASPCIMNTLVIPDSVEYIEGGAFMYCGFIEEVVLGKNVKTIGDGAFSGVHIKSVDIPASVTEMTGAFDGSDELETINVSPDNRYYTDIDGVLYSKDKTELVFYPQGRDEKQYEIPEGVTCIKYGAFDYSLESIIIPTSVTTIEDDLRVDKIYYKGSRSDWKKIKIDEDNYAGVNAKIIYNAD